LQARLLILCARFFLSKPQTEFAVWVFVQICDDLSVSLTADSSPERGAFGLAYHQKSTIIRRTSDAFTVP
jgi:hypothetical protein